MNATRQYLALGLASVLIVSAIFFLESSKPSQKGEKVPDIALFSQKRAQEKEQKYERAKEIASPAGFINTDPLTISQFIGKKIILVDFWTYSCINCQRTLPYLASWWKAYRDKGLVIIGIHTPEFKFEEKYENVLQATQKFGVKYPVVLDNEYGTWRAYGNRYWPRKYLIDIDGFIAYDHIGEGGYVETEQKIRELLGERMQVLGMEDRIAGSIAKPKNVEEVEHRKIGSPETYFGALRNKNFGSGTPGQEGLFEFLPPFEIAPNILYLVGQWRITGEYAESVGSKETKVMFRYRARKVHLVASSEQKNSIMVLQDGKPLGDKNRGSDITGSSVAMEDEGLYRLVENQDYETHTLELLIKDPGFRAFSLTFG